MNGLVSNATWTGVPLAALLEECRIAREAREVVFFGADSTTERKWSAAGREFTTPHGRSLHVQDARESNALLAFSMNGRPLPAEQGFPLRLVLPGWYGMAQIKWLTRIEVIDRRYEGQHMSRNYHSLHRRSDNTVLDTSITRNRLKSVVARLTGSAGEYSVSGAAWGGERPISAVEVRVDSGPWKRATLSATSEPNAWLLWSVDVGRLVPGKHEIVSRAIDDRGTIQPTREEWKRRFASNREDHSQWVRRVVISA
jgi:DMSO/TMAO reductase YedYZ molybdopterin-dependent catalytic subunit